MEKKKEKVEEVLPLSNLKPGQGGVIDHINTVHEKKYEKFVVLGVLPGKKIELIQKFPAYVFQIGNSQIVVDGDMAKVVYVRVT